MEIRVKYELYPPYKIAVGVLEFEIVERVGDFERVAEWEDLTRSPSRGILRGCSGEKKEWSEMALF